MPTTSESNLETPHELVMVNEFPVAPEAAWRAWTDPEQFAAWWVAPQWTTHDVVLDVRPSGRFAAIQSADDGSVTVPFRGFFVDVDPGRMLSFTLSDSDDPDAESRTLLTVRLEGSDTGTRQEFRQTGVVTDEHFEALKTGTEMFFSQLDQHLRARVSR